MSLRARTVQQMTTTVDDDMTHVLMRYARCTETITAEYHPDDNGMPYVLHIVGGKHAGTVIHCQTEASVVRLFNEVVLYRKMDLDHPYLVAV